MLREFQEEIMRLKAALAVRTPLHHGWDRDGNGSSVGLEWA